jgi:ERCC4-related helicase
MAIAMPEQGQLVSVRQRHYVVTEVAKSSLPEQPLKSGTNGRQSLVSLSSVEDDGLGEELQVVWEIEPGTKVIEKIALPDPTGFDEPAFLDAFLDAVRWGASSQADAKAVQSPFRSGIDIEDYQLDPVVRAVQMPRVNLLIADSVGLGKTIEAGLVILELILRHRARRVVVACPASLQVQWRDQMRDKFGLDFRIVDSELMRQLRRERGIHANPWTHFPRLITSIDFVKRERPLRLFEETLPGPDDPVYPRRYDILVVDEAHNCAPSGTGKYATDSQRTQALRLLAPHFEHKLFLTATPHNGYPESFSALLELLDDQRFARGTAPDRRQLEAVMVRRLKSELPPKLDPVEGWVPRFPERKLKALEVDYPQEERDVHATLRKYAKLRETGFSDSAERCATEFVLKTLKKRLFSSPAAFRTTLIQHESTLGTAKRKRAVMARPTVGILQRQLDQADEEYANDEEYEQATDEAVDAASRLFRDSTHEEAKLLKQMKTWAEPASSRNDAKAQVLIDWLKAHIRPNGKWNDERVIIFTEYRATQNWLLERLAMEGFTQGDRLMMLYGGMDTDKREAVKAAFQFDPKHSPVRILLATDAASEGIDLQNHCSKLFHYEIPWNPNRMEQRNGRIDRHGQRAKEVLVYHFVGKGYNQREQANQDIPAGELEGDLEFLMRAARKVNQIREDLGNVGPVIAQQVEEAMLGKRTRLNTAAAEKNGEPLREMMRFERDLRARCAQLLAQLDETKRDLHLEPSNIQKVVQIALQLADQPPLIESKVPGISPAFDLPAFKGSWQYCTEGLVQKHTGKTRPIVFDPDLAKGRDDVVLAHLNHRLVQMCLRLLRAEVWSTEGKKKLHRITTRTVPDKMLRDPAMIAHARLVVVGGDSTRLHEEIITAGGLLTGGKFARMNVGQVQEAVDAGQQHEPGESMKKVLLKLYGEHTDALAKSLEARMRDRLGGMTKLLVERQAKETNDITLILTELQKSIQTKLNDPEITQMTFEGWSDPEREQLERNMDALRRRMVEIPAEIERETTAIKARFANPQPRMFPVAVTFLVPQKLARS